MICNINRRPYIYGCLFSCFMEVGNGKISEVLLRVIIVILLMPCTRTYTNGSVSVSYEDGSDVSIGDTRVAFRVYERYSMAGSNRVSMSIVIVGNNDNIDLTAVTSGGSQAVFFKINTWGESTFLDLCINFVERYIAKKNS